MERANRAAAEVGCAAESSRQPSSHAYRAQRFSSAQTVATEVRSAEGAADDEPLSAGPHAVAREAARQNVLEFCIAAVVSNADDGRVLIPRDFLAITSREPGAVRVD